MSNPHAEVRTEVMKGNQAIARGLVEAGVEMASAHPFTQGRDILSAIVESNKKESGSLRPEWSVNGRCAFEAAFGAALSGRRSACIENCAGLHMALPALLHGREKEIHGGLAIVACDDPDPLSHSQRDARQLAALFKIPTFDPASPKEAADLAYYAMEYAATHRTPVLLRVTHRVRQGREDVPVFSPGARKVSLEEGITVKGTKKLGIIASGAAHSLARDVLAELALQKALSLYKVAAYPLAQGVMEFVQKMNRVLVLEERSPVLEMMIGRGDKVLGKRTGAVPVRGEISHDAVRNAVQELMRE
jgi:indolepyruvate ferredoxin oxidoreductase, alpha subunit